MGERMRRSGDVTEVTRHGRRILIIDFRYTDNAGRAQRYRRDAEVQTLTAARAEATRLRARLTSTGTLAARPAASTVATFLASPAWAQHLATKCRPATRERYEALLRQGIREAFGGKRLDAITAADVRAYEATLRQRDVQPRGPLGLVRTILRVAVDTGALATMPELPKLPKQSRKLPDAPSAAEVAAMLQHANGWLRLAIALAAFAGLRMGEVRALEVRDVDQAGARLLVRRAMSANEVVTPKSGDERMVPMAPELAAMLADAVRLKLPAARVVVNREGRTPGRQHVLAALKKLQARHGLPERSFHSLRHAFCSALVRGGASVEAVRLLAGHADLSVTARYLHATGTELRAAIASLPRLGQ
jgi:integrase